MNLFFSLTLSLSLAHSLFLSLSRVVSSQNASSFRAKKRRQQQQQQQDNFVHVFYGREIKCFQSKHKRLVHVVVAAPLLGVFIRFTCVLSIREYTVHLNIFK